jgi:hypothetical protein
VTPVKAPRFKGYAATRRLLSIHRQDGCSTKGVFRQNGFALKRMSVGKMGIYCN